MTEPDYFKGSLRDLKKVAETTVLPVLCKDFIIDPIQIDFAKLSGADAILLIAAILDQEKLDLFYKYAKSLDLDVLVESHNQIEIMKSLKLKDALLGINNRNLKTFNTDINVTERLTVLIPQGRFVVSESGIKSVEDMKRLSGAGAHAFLVGETLMRDSTDGFVRAFTGCSETPKIKICGLKRVSDIRVANELNLDYVGFVFAKSKRMVDTKTAKILISQLKPSIKSVGVFVNKPKEDVQRIAEVCGLDVIQLHGDESVEEYRLDRPVWKAVSINSTADIKDISESKVSGYVFDTFSSDMAGGDWQDIRLERSTTRRLWSSNSSGGVKCKQRKTVYRCSETRCRGYQLWSRG